MAPNSGAGDIPPHVQRLLASVAGEKGKEGSLVGGLGGAQVVIATRKVKQESGKAFLESARKAGKDALLAGAPLVQLPSSFYGSLLAYPSPFHWHLRAMVATYLTVRGVATCLQLPLSQIVDCTKVLGAVGWEGGDGGEDVVDNHLLLEGEKEEEGREEMVVRMLLTTTCFLRGRRKRRAGRRWW